MACGTSEPLSKPADVKTKSEGLENGTEEVDKQTGSQMSATGPNKIAEKDVTVLADGQINAPANDAQTPMDVEKRSESDANKDVAEQVDDKAQVVDEKPEAAVKQDEDSAVAIREKEHADTTTLMDVDELENMESDDEEEPPLLFRCVWCKRCAHYEHCEWLRCANSTIEAAICSC